MEKNKIILDLKKLLTELQDAIAHQSNLSSTSLDALILQLYACQENLRALKYIQMLDVQSSPVKEIKEEKPVAPIDEVVNKTVIPTQETISFEEKIITVVKPKESIAEPAKQVHEVLTKPMVKEVNHLVQSKSFTLDLNDRIYLQRELFNNDSELMRNFLDTLSKQESFDLKLQCIAEQNWDIEKESVQRLMQLLEKTFAV